MAKFVDPEELTFTREELFEASCCFLPIEEARRMADHLAHLGPHAIRARTDRRATWRKGGVDNADKKPLHYWVYPNELLPALASLSSEASARVAELSRFLNPENSDRAP
jgi:hypothetical protein